MQYNSILTLDLQDDAKLVLNMNPAFDVGLNTINLISKDTV